MGVNDHVRSEGQGHPATGARIRRLRITSRGVRRSLFTLGIAVWVALAGGVLAGFEWSPTHSALEEARRQNVLLRAQQEALRKYAVGLAGRLLDSVERERRVARLAGTPRRAWEGQNLHRPARDADYETLRAWHSEQGELLEALRNEAAMGRNEVRVKQASASAPASRGTGPVRNAAVFQMADNRSGRRQETAPARR